MDLARSYLGARSWRIGMHSGSANNLEEGASQGSFPGEVVLHDKLSDATLLAVLSAFEPDSWPCIVPNADGCPRSASWLGAKAVATV